MDRNTIATAFVSGRLGQAIFREGDALYALSVDGDRRLASPAELSKILEKGTEYELVRGKSFEAVQDTLRGRVRGYNGLFFILSLLDVGISLSTRVVAAQTAEDILGEPEAQEFVSRRFLSSVAGTGARPPPPIHQPVGRVCPCEMPSRRGIRIAANPRRIVGSLVQDV